MVNSQISLFTIGPKDEDYKDGDLQFINKVKGGNVPKEFIPSVEKGFKDYLKSGCAGRLPNDSLRLLLLMVASYPVDSDQLSFELTAHNAFQEWLS